MKKFAFLLFIFVFCAAGIGLSFSASAVYPPNFEPKSQHIYMVNVDTDTVVYERNSREHIYPASTTKMMTAILAIENCLDLRGTNITISENVMDMLKGTDSSTAGFVAGEQITMLDLLYGLLLPSGNECALAVAEYIGDGDISKFVDMMNTKASDLGMKDTHFANPHGLHDDNHYTSAYDMYLLAKAAMEYPAFTEICGSAKYTIYETNKHQKRVIKSTNFLLDVNSTYYMGAVKGIKTGRTSKSGNCLVSTATKNGYTYICIAMGAPLKDKDGKSYKNNLSFTDTKQFYEWAFSDLQLKEIVSDTQIITEIPLKNAWNKDYIALVPNQTYKALIPITVDAATVVIEPDVMESVSAPVKKGDVCGTATLKYGTQEIGKVNLVATESVDRNFFVYSANVIINVVKSPAFLITIGVIILLVIVYIIYAYRHNRKLEKIKSRRQPPRYY